MKQRNQRLNKKIIGGLSLFLVCLLGFTIYFGVRDRDKVQAAEYSFLDSSGNQVPSGGTFTMRRTSDFFQLLGLQTGDTVVWESMNTSILTITNATAWTALLQAQTTGTVAVSVTITHSDSTTEVATMTLDIVFSVNEYLEGVSGVRLEKLYPEDERKALIMDYGSVVPIGHSGSGNNFLKLTFGNGQEAEWRSGNDDVVSYYSGSKKGNSNEFETPPSLHAVGAGPTQLTVTWTEGTTTYTDTIDVYVRPWILTENADADNNPSDIPDSDILAGKNGSAGSIMVKDGDVIQITVKGVANPQIAIGDKITWVISKGQGEQAVLVRDSLGNMGEHPEDINLYFYKGIDNKAYYRVDAKSGEYNIQFYVKGTYKNFEDSKTSDCACNPVNLQTKVECDFTNKTVTVSIGGSYNLSEAFNIPLETLRKYFNARILGDNGNTIIDLVEAQMLVRAKALGDARLEVSLKEGVSTSEIPGFPDDYDTVIVNITVADTFSLNITETTMSVGSKLSLHGIIGSEAVAEASQFKWSVDRAEYLSLSDTSGQYVTVTATRATPANSPARVTLAWTDKDGVTWVSYCTITVLTAAENFMITPDNSSIEVGGGVTLRTNIPGGRANIVWMSSDESIVTVSANDGNISAEVRAGTQVGSAVITAFNTDNNAYATAVVTVTAPISSIRIDKGETFNTTLAMGFVFLKAIYEPANATETELVWKAMNFNPDLEEPVGTVDENGVVTLYTEGQLLITVEPKYNPNKVEARCLITVKEDPITKITPDVTELEMIVGDIYEVTTTVIPDVPSDPTLNWSVLSGSNVVSVDQEGRITALSPGTAVVMVQGNPRRDGKSPASATIAVTVRDRLQSIEFSKKYYEIEVDEDLQLEVLFNPAENVNKTLHFESADPETATVTDDGVVRGIAVGGPVVITCWAEDIGKQSPIQCYLTVSKKKIPATDFAIEPTSKEVMVGYSFQLTPIFTPEDTSDQTVLYESADPTVAKVDENGKVTGVKPGVTAIICTAAQSDFIKSCTVTVIPAVKLTLDPPAREIAVGQSFTIKKIVSPNTEENNIATWKSSNTAIATVDSAGKVTAKKIGTCTITCTLTRSGVSASCRVTVAKLKTTIKLNKTNIRIGIGQKYRLIPTINTNAGTIPKVKWKSSNKKVATVSSNGKVKGKKVGSVKITATTKDAIKAKATCRVTVIRRVTKVSVKPDFTTVFVGHSKKIKATVKPANASIKKIQWSSSDKAICRVSGGKITGLQPGEVTITAKAKDGSGKKAECIVKVLEETPVSSIVVAQNNMTLKKGDKAKLSYSVLPNNNSDKLKFASDNKRVAKVNSSGVIQAVGTGTAEITIMSSGGVTTKVTVNVVALNKTSLTMRQYDTETLRVFGTSDNVTWYTSNNRVATVSGGTVTGRGQGSTYIYAYVNGCKLTCKVTITSVNSRR